ncbi:folate-binding protein [Methylomarinum sp. Ch1-1]|uniref:Folate-binding protein n=1 Tax=Methylomarinum roseum TaxID=3067653 RepID=A0AAU7NRB7_9GAMM|nr:folate-binding protein [Methylomarinum sp. Ch1-1]MDP4520502.1 folate-binding protein [Methylomarinum sp. Ch1-1]
MNSDWIAFLQSKGARLTDDRHIEFSPSTPNTIEERLYPVTHLTTFKVSGDDASTFLQGQLTCNINDLTDDQAGFAAYCNAKGRVISNLLICRQHDAFIVILPTSLLDKVINKLRMYILRAKVTLTREAENLCLLGLNSKHPSVANITLPVNNYQVTKGDPHIIKLPSPSPRYLILADLDHAKRFWSQTVDSQILQKGDSNLWSYQDLSAGIPWFDESVSEQYIPQMLNVDKLGGISFNKGCYTGQEIVARTHYLGKAKRELYLAECSNAEIIDRDTTIIDGDNGESSAKIVAFCCLGQTCRLLLVMPTSDSDQKTLVLNNSSQDKITLIPFQ